MLAEPVYLNCSYENEDGKVVKFQVKADESNGSITHSYENGFTFNADGFFAADKITYKSVNNAGGLKITQQYQISRIDLSLLYSLVAAPPAEYAKDIETVTSAEVGKCEISRLPRSHERAL